jgi:hypothetical protein
MDEAHGKVVEAQSSFGEFASDGLNSSLHFAFRVSFKAHD